MYVVVKLMQFDTGTTKVMPTIWKQESTWVSKCVIKQDRAGLVKDKRNEEPVINKQSPEEDEPTGNKAPFVVIFGWLFIVRYFGSLF